MKHTGSANMDFQSRHLSNYLGLTLVILGLAILGQQLPLPLAHPLPPGLFLIGIGVALAYVDAPRSVFLSGEIEVGGWSSLFWDMLLMAIGMLVAVAGLLEWFWPGRVMSTMKLMGWGQLLIGGGVLLALSGALHLRDAMAVRGSGWTLLFTVPGMVAWGALLLLGLLLVAVGVLQLTAPQMLAAWLRAIIPTMPSPPQPGG